MGASEITATYAVLRFLIRTSLTLNSLKINTSVRHKQLPNGTFRNCKRRARCRPRFSPQSLRVGRRPSDRIWRHGPCKSESCALGFRLSLAIKPMSNTKNHLNHDTNRKDPGLTPSQTYRSVTDRFVSSPVECTTNFFIGMLTGLGSLNPKPSDSGFRRSAA